MEIFPFILLLDSSDVWTHPELFLLDDEKQPKAVAGVPPDAFSDTGQLWGIRCMIGTIWSIQDFNGGNIDGLLLRVV